MKLISIFLFLIFLFSYPLWSQNTFKASDFSDKYYATIFLEEPNQVFSAGWIAVYDKQTDKELVKIESEELAASFSKDGEVTTNVQELPYGEQSLIICSDFNCDGIDDLAIQDGQNSCYHGPSYIIFISKNGILVEDDSLTRLAQEYCGMPQIDCVQKRAFVMTKSGCCWHQYQTYDLEKGVPRLIENIEENAFRFPFVTTTVSRWDSEGKEESDITYSLNVLDEDVIFSFEIAKNKKKVYLIRISDSKLCYCLEKVDGTLEFIYPENGDGVFQLATNKNLNALSFSNANATYTIYNSPSKVGISVQIGGKAYDMPGVLLSRKGNISASDLQSFENVSIQ